MTPSSSKCCVCGSALPPPIYTSVGDWSLTSLCATIKGTTTVRYCDECGHLQTAPLPDLEAYYDQEYKILISSEDEDQLLMLGDGRTVFRTAYQVDVLRQKVKLPANARVLDYGCAKSATLRKLVENQSDINPFVFDVSEMYVPFWDKFVPIKNRAINVVPDSWKGSFDLITSFFALEHVEFPSKFVEQVSSLLAEGGTLYGIVPNVWQNSADFVVADHVNHFSAQSIHHLLTHAGLETIEIDEETHPGAWIFIARKSHNSNSPALKLNSRSADDVRKTAEYWTDFAKRVQLFEADHSSKASAVYGSGFYGTYIVSCMKHPENVRCFLDKNPYQQGRTLLDRSIIAPEKLPEDVSVLYVGLNPRNAQNAIASVTSLANRPLAKFFP